MQTIRKAPCAPASIQRRRVRRPLGHAVALVVALVVDLVMVCIYLSGGAMVAQTVRKAKSSPPPEYPELARKNHIHGVARVEVTVVPDGSVTDVRELGGNPVLVESLVHAVKKWKYEASDRTSVIEVRFDFNDQE